MSPQHITSMARSRVKRKRLIATRGRIARECFGPAPLADRLRTVNHPRAAWRSPA